MNSFGKFCSVECGAGLEVGAERSTRLGHNLYAGGRGAGAPDRLEGGAGEEEPRPAPPPREETADLAREELNLLAKLIGAANPAKTEIFRLNLFDTEEVPGVEAEEEAGARDTSQHTVNIDLAAGRDRGQLEKIINEMTVGEEEQQEEDLLALMDKAV